MRKRTAAFIGSTDWRKRDVRVSTSNWFYLRASDKASRISVTYYIPVPEDRIVAELAHRVIQFTT